MSNINLKLEGNSNFFIQEAYKVFRSNLQFCGQDIKTIVVTSCYENEGKSTISLQLGKSFAELNKKVLVIDADMRKSVMAGRNASIQNAHGLSEILTGLDSFENSVCHTQYEGLDVVFSGKYPPNPVELLGSVHFESLLNDVREIYDYVIIDTAPLGLVIDAAVIAPNCDGTVIVMSDKVKYSVAREVIDQLEKSNAKILGVVRNKISAKRGIGYYKKGYYKYGYRYGYGYGYGQKKSGVYGFTPLVSTEAEAETAEGGNAPVAGPEPHFNEERRNMTNRARAKARSDARSRNGMKKKKK